MAKSSFLILAAIFLGIITPSCLSDHILYSGETLSPGEFLNYNRCVFIVQEDCNLVLYDIKKLIWAINTDKLDPRCHLSMQSDGNLVVYSTRNDPIWASTTGGVNGNYVCVLQKDQNVVIYGTALWATRTNIHGDGFVRVLGSAPQNSTAEMLKLVRKYLITK